jgi:hypothetical protein
MLRGTERLPAGRQKAFLGQGYQLKPRHRAGTTNAVCQPQLDKLRLSLHCRGLGKRQEITYPLPLPFDRLSTLLREGEGALKIKPW